MDAMLEFAARHNIAAQVEYFPMSKVNEVLDHLRSAKARYRIMLEGIFDPDGFRKATDKLHPMTV